MRVTYTFDTGEDSAFSEIRIELSPTGEAVDISMHRVPGQPEWEESWLRPKEVREMGEVLLDFVEKIEEAEAERHTGDE